MDPNLDPVALEFLTAQTVCHIAVIDGDEPYVTPISFVVDDERLMFRTHVGKRIDALRIRPRVCIEASAYDDGSYGWFSVVAWGNAHEASAADEERCIELLFDKYRDQYGDGISMSRPEPLAGMLKVFVVPIDKLTSASSSGFLQPAMRPGRL